MVACPSGSTIVNVDRKQERLFEEALRMPPEARAALANELIRSLDHAMDPAVEAAWVAEVARRLRELEDGTVQGLPWAEVRKRLEQVLAKPR